MMTRWIYLKFSICTLLVFLVTAAAWANGRHPGVRASDVAVNALIEDRSGKTHKWSQAQIRSAKGVTRIIEYRLGETTGQIPLAKISKISFTNEEASQDGFASADIVLDDRSRASLDVRVKEDGVDIMLVGYSTLGEGKIVLLKCRHIEFSLPSVSDQGGAAEPRPPLAPLTMP